MSVLLTVLAATAAVSFSHITVEQGLSQNTVVSICQDRNGIMWFSTNNGLNRYDGYDFTYFRHDDNDPGSIADNLVNKVFTDSSGTLWIGTEKGLSRYNPGDDSFFNTPAGERGGIIDIVDIDEGHLMVITSDRQLMSYDIESDSFSAVTIPQVRINPTCLLRTEGRIYVGGFQRRIFRYDIKEGGLSKVDGFHCDAPIVSLSERSKDEIWIGTEGGGLYLFNAASGVTKTIPESSTDRVRALCYDLDGRLWIGGRTGLEIMDIHDGSVKRIANTPERPDGLSY
ncbi:MAG: hypothetical protein IJ799_08985, partial [Bacteroidales bacterium]|nr:hypothetical protein [Bacteroidales bacterium]